MLESLFANRINTKESSRLIGIFPDTKFEDTISFGGGAPDEKLFPVDGLVDAYHDAIDKQKSHAFQYHDVEGPKRLRDFLADRAINKAKIEGITGDDIMLTAGGQQGIDLVAKLLINPGDSIAVEAPSYIGALAAFDTYEPTYYDIPMENDGANLNILESTLKKHPEIKLFYSVPDFHNPTGVTMSLEKRQRLVELANKYNFIILEDTPYRDLRYHGESLPSIKSFDMEGRVIFLSSFSKILSPAFRLGWLVASPEIKEQLTNLKLSEDLEVPYIPSATVDSYIAHNDLDAHIDSLKTVYRLKLDKMYECLQKNLPDDAEISHPEGGFFLWVKLNESIDTSKLLWEEAVPDAHLVFVPSKNFYAEKDVVNGMRINFTGSTDEQIEEGCNRLGELLSKGKIKLAI